MVSTFTPNVGFEEPARGDYVGTWDLPVNANETLTDLIVGGTATISGAAGSVVLSAAQYQCKTITFNSTLLASITVTFPTSFVKSYEIFNQCTGSSAFVITLQTTAAGGATACAPPGTYINVINAGTGIRFTSLERIGTFWDYAGSSVPAWVSGSNPVPYLSCDGGTFSATTYPQLAVILGSTTLPDARGRVRATLNQGTGRLTTAAGNMDGNTNLAGGGSESVTLASSQLPASIPYNDPGHTHPYSFRGGTTLGNQNFPAGGAADNYDITDTSCSATIGITINPSTGATGTGGGHYNVQPTYIGGITMVRAG
jgi:hypothetical protein